MVNSSFDEIWSDTAVINVKSNQAILFLLFFALHRFVEENCETTININIYTHIYIYLVIRPHFINRRRRRNIYSTLPLSWKWKWMKKNVEVITTKKVDRRQREFMCEREREKSEHPSLLNKKSHNHHSVRLNHSFI